MHSFTASPDGISYLPIAINVSLNSNIMTHNPITYSPSTPILSSILTSRSFQTHPSILLTPISNPYNTSLYSPFSSNSFPRTGPSVFPGPSSIFPCLRSSFAITGSIPSPSLSSTVTPCTLPTSFSSSSLQPDFGLHPSRRLFTVPRATLPGRRRAPRGRRRQVTSTASCQTSPIPSYYWPGFQPNRVFLGGPSTDGTLDLAPMPRAYNHFPTSLPLDPFHYDFFSVLKAASPIVTFHCPSPFTQKKLLLYLLHSLSSWGGGKTTSGYRDPSVSIIIFSIFDFLSFFFAFQPLLICLMFFSFKGFPLPFEISGCSKSMRKSISIFLIWA